MGVLLILVMGGVLALFFENEVDKGKFYLQEDRMVFKDIGEVLTKHQKNKPEEAVAVISSHHLLAKDLIAETFSKIDDKQIEQVLIVSPDHFKQIKDTNCLIMTANVGWKTETEVINPGSEIITKWMEGKDWCNDINSFRGEHGITALVPFIRHYFPRATIVPMILRQNNNLEFFNHLGEKMAKEVSKDKTLVVVSSDFCHYMANNKAKENDKISLKVLENKEVDEINLVNNDCHECLAFLFGYLDKEDQFKLIKNSNSFEISGEDPEYVTSYINGYYQ